MEILSFGREKNPESWRKDAILGFCNSRYSCKACPLSRTFCCHRQKTLTDLSIEEQKEMLRLIVKEDE